MGMGMSMGMGKRMMRAVLGNEQSATFPGMSTPVVAVGALLAVVVIVTMVSRAIAQRGAAKDSDVPDHVSCADTLPSHHTPSPSPDHAAEGMNAHAAVDATYCTISP
eukprot:m.1459676 g.1459676  ORF g.1459676 m.1459676 type:complete len:107 (-) comp25128_c0_seq18:4104-4424(-)